MIRGIHGLFYSSDPDATRAVNKPGKTRRAAKAKAKPPRRRARR